MGATLRHFQGPQRTRNWGSGAKIRGSGAKIWASQIKTAKLVPLMISFFTNVIHGGYFEALSGAPKGPNFWKTLFNVEVIFDVKRIGALEPRLRALRLKLGPLRSRPMHKYPP